MVMRRKELSTKMKVKVVNAVMMPSLMYGCDVWSLMKQQQGRVQATQVCTYVCMFAWYATETWNADILHPQTAHSLLSSTC